MRFCNTHGIPHSVFLDWDRSDQAKALATLIEEARRCKMCGTSEWEWEEDRFAYEAVENICHGCEMKESIEQDTTYRSGPGRYISLERPE